MLSPYLFNLHAEYIMQNTSLDESQDCQEKYQQPQICQSNSGKQTGTKEPVDEGERRKAGLKLNIQKTKITASGPITSWQIEREKVETVTDSTFLGSKSTVDGDYSHEIKHLLLVRKAVTKPDSIFKKQRYYFAHKGPYSQSYSFSFQ